MDLRRAERLLRALGAGDALGCTPASADPAHVLAAYRQHRDRGWPFRAVGGGPFDRARGETTANTATARCLLRSVLQAGGRFDGAAFARQLAGWSGTGPRGVDETTWRALAALDGGEGHRAAGRLAWRQAPGAVTSGSLARNGIVPALASAPDDVFLLAVQHGLATHYAPLCVLCCACQSYLLLELLAGRAVPPAGWLAGFERAFLDWLGGCREEVVAAWREDTASELGAALAALRAAEWDPGRFTPTGADDRARAGQPLRTLQVAVWALHWSQCDHGPELPGLPAEVFARRGPFALGWAALVGGDGGACGAVAGPLLAAAHGGLPRELTDGLPPLL